jgi:hypothetical protein
MLCFFGCFDLLRSFRQKSLGCRPFLASRRLPVSPSTYIYLLVLLAGSLICLGACWFGSSGCHHGPPERSKFPRDWFCSICTVWEQFAMKMNRGRLGELNGACGNLASFGVICNWTSCHGFLSSLAPTAVEKQDLIPSQFWRQTKE